MSTPLGKSDHASITYTYYCTTDVKEHQGDLTERSWYEADLTLYVIIWHQLTGKVSLKI